jgi:dGTPase
MINKKLAPFAAKSKYSKGRKFKEQFKDKRYAFERDRDRIVHSEAFRRLEYKTQVFVIHAGDYYRTRLTHSLEVAQVARGIARRLNLNEDLTEAIALAHDLGHTPFGHNGEHKLNELMKNNGGFEHNLQSYRIVSFLEKRYPDFNGLNLTFETLEGLVKHSSKYDNPMNMKLTEFHLDLMPSLEAQIIDLADEIAYNNHDIDDGLKSGLISFENLYENVKLWREVVNLVRKRYGKMEKQMIIYRAISFLISNLMDDLIKNSKHALHSNRIETVDDVRNFKSKLISFSSDINSKNNELKKFLYNNLYTNHKVIAMKIKAENVIKTLFNAYKEYPKLLPEKYRSRVGEFTLERVITDYIAGMTDRYALDEYNKIV